MIQHGPIRENARDFCLNYQQRRVISLCDINLEPLVAISHLENGGKAGTDREQNMHHLGEKSIPQ